MNNGQSTDKRVFIQPFVDDAWSEQCSSIYVFVDNIRPTSHLESVVGVTVEIIVHSKISVISGDGDEILNPEANPNDSDRQGNIVVAWKNRATVLLKSILAELNGFYVDGVGELTLDQNVTPDSKVELNLWNHRSFYGYTVKFNTKLAGVSDNPRFSL